MSTTGSHVLIQDNQRPDLGGRKTARQLQRLPQVQPECSAADRVSWFYGTSYSIPSYINVWMSYHENKLTLRLFEHIHTLGRYVLFIIFTSTLPYPIKPDHPSMHPGNQQKTHLRVQTSRVPHSNGHLLFCPSRANYSFPLILLIVFHFPLSNHFHPILNPQTLFPWL